MNLRKKGFEVPIADWLRNDLKKLVEDSSSKSNLDRLGIIDTHIIEEWKQGLYSNKRDTSWQLWTLVSYKQWINHFSEQKRPSLGLRIKKITKQRLKDKEEFEHQISEL